MRFPKDYAFVQMLLSKDGRGWDEFGKQIESAIKKYLYRRYPGLLGETEADEVYGKVLEFFLNDDRRYLREYEGKESLARHLGQAVDWKVKDWLRRHWERLQIIPLPDDSGAENKGGNKGDDERVASEAADLPYELREPVKALDCLTDGEKWALMLRYYDYTGFPEKEVKKLAAHLGIEVEALARKIEQLIEVGYAGELDDQRAKSTRRRERLADLVFRIHKINIKEHSLQNHQWDDDASIQRYSEMATKKAALQDRLRRLLKDLRPAVTVPYDRIAVILQVEEVTVRSRIHSAKAKLRGTQTIRQQGASLRKEDGRIYL